MNIFDIVGPVMVGPSSSHTAGAARIGMVTHKLMSEDIIEAHIYFHGSFLATGKGHGTDRALVAGLLGLAVDDTRIPDSFDLAEQAGMKLTFDSIDLGDSAHPNSVKMELKGVNGKYLEVVASSIGGGRIMINEIDSLKANFSGDRPTLIVLNNDTPGKIALITAMLSAQSINVATLQLDRDSRGGRAVTVIESDQEISEKLIKGLELQDGILKVTYLSLK